MSHTIGFSHFNMYRVQIYYSAVAVKKDSGEHEAIFSGFDTLSPEEGGTPSNVGMIYDKVMRTVNGKLGSLAETHYAKMMIMEYKFTDSEMFYADTFGNDCGHAEETSE